MIHQVFAGFELIQVEEPPTVRKRLEYFEVVA